MKSFSALLGFSLISTLLQHSISLADEKKYEFEFFWPIFGKGNEAFSGEDRVRVYLGPFQLGYCKGKYPSFDQITIALDDWAKDITLPVRIEFPGDKHVKSINSRLIRAAMGEIIFHDNHIFKLPNPILIDKDKFLWKYEIPAKTISQQGEYAMESEMTLSDGTKVLRYTRIIMAGITFKELDRSEAAPEYKKPELKSIKLEDLKHK